MATSGNPEVLRNSSGLIICLQASLLLLELVGPPGTALQTRALSGIVLLVLSTLHADILLTHSTIAAISAIAPRVG